MSDLGLSHPSGSSRLGSACAGETQHHAGGVGVKVRCHALFKKRPRHMLFKTPGLRIYSFPKSSSKRGGEIDMCQF